MDLIFDRRAIEIEENVFGMGGVLGQFKFGFGDIVDTAKTLQMLAADTSDDGILGRSHLG